MPIRTLVIDDSGIYRRILSSTIEMMDELELVDSAADAKAGLDIIANKDVDLVTLDMTMPVMDGLDFLRHLRDLPPNRTRPAVAVVSGVAPSATDLSMKALELGALDIIPKPQGFDAEANRKELQASLQRVVNAIKCPQHSSSSRPTTKAPPPKSSAAGTTSEAEHFTSAPLAAICIGASTGGPQALTTLLPGLRQHTDLPIVIVNHIPTGFDAGLASSLERHCPGSVSLAEHGAPLKQGMTVLAPADKHLSLKSRPQLSLHLNDSPAENGCRPAVDVLFRSLLTCPHHRFCCMVLTGMGNDGARHLPELSAAGHVILAQDRDSCTVYGMPRAAMASGAVDSQAELSALPEAFMRHVNPSRVS